MSSSELIVNDLATRLMHRVPQAPNTNDSHNTKHSSAQRDVMLVVLRSTLTNGEGQMCVVDVPAAE
jgi:hypothetical protein